MLGLEAIALVACIATRFWDLAPLWRYHKLLPHLGKAGAAELSVEVIEKGGHVI